MTVSTLFWSVWPWIIFAELAVYGHNITQCILELWKDELTNGTHNPQPSTDSDCCQPRQTGWFSYILKMLFACIDTQRCSWQSKSSVFLLSPVIFTVAFPKDVFSAEIHPLVMVLIQPGFPKPGLCLLSASILCILLFELWLIQLCIKVILCTWSVFYANKHIFLFC